ncbi:hypothetical protein N7481_009156 [Penicillium waksmanii]|uniref:uncharacterized protein n=1 Tax=Penicillium waksmanii TaxID=69791 RepID=UPI00254904F5|nr:uncharacterized protein N7481_009156 [Penicillium waksmanii]KAJ5975449.1 hypothetical protein N7481_009156 [Penicillium waksmanii]
MRAPATSTGANPAYTSGCAQKNFDKATWDKEKMDDFVLDLTLLAAINNAKVQFASTSADINQDFVKTDLPDACDTWVAIIIGGALGAVGGVYGAAAAAIPAMAKAGGITAGVAGAASGLDGIGLGIANTALPGTKGASLSE